MISLIAGEADADSLIERLANAQQVCTSALAIFETATGLARIAKAPLADALDLVDGFLTETNATVLPIDRRTALIAVDAFDRFGKGRHPAALNMGDCFAYACARQVDAALLCNGNDFPRTDINLG